MQKKRRLGKKRNIGGGFGVLKLHGHPCGKGRVAILIKKEGMETKFCSQGNLSTKKKRPPPQQAETPESEAKKSPQLISNRRNG